ncbi:hypothetical protein AURDEDRAFT_160882 [Auricularia subglabra TFB-10046 SS5]|nr:hypothetical protein AURDEDRAFT_160882 [Auricularia subglabra TFB-10046 SS5]
MFLKTLASPRALTALPQTARARRASQRDPAPLQPQFPPGPTLRATCLPQSRTPALTTTSSTQRKERRTRWHLLQLTMRVELTLSIHVRG